MIAILLLFLHNAVDVEPLFGLLTEIHGGVF